jgi:uncharacterized BrkB/YihY/UPF0761 family membrane protein
MSASSSTAFPNKVDRNTSWFGLIKQMVTEWIVDDVQTWAAAVACYTLLALALLVVIAIKFLSVFLTGRMPQEQIQNQAQAWMGAGGWRINCRDRNNRQSAWKRQGRYRRQPHPCGG